MTETKIYYVHGLNIIVYHIDKQSAYNFYVDTGLIGECLK